MKILRSFVWFVLMATAAAGPAQSLLLEYKGQALTNQSVIVRSGTPDSLDMTTWLTITNISPDPLQVMAKKEEISLVPGAGGSICWAGYCYTPDVFESLYPLDLGPGEPETGCFAHFSQSGNTGTSTVRWIYFVVDHPEDSVCVTIHYLTYPAGTRDPVPDCGKFSYPFPNPADRELFIRRTGVPGGDIVLSLSNPAGRMVSRASFPAGMPVLTVSTRMLPPGIYFYFLESEAGIVGSGSCIILH